MIVFAVYTVAALGLAYIVGHAVISRPLREALWEASEAAPLFKWIVMLMECPACLGFWIGLVAGLVGCSPVPFGGPLQDAAVLALYTSGSNLLLARCLGIMQFTSAG